MRQGQRERAHEALDWFLQHVRPAGWNHWAEVVLRDRDEPRFIGDMPHGWVGSDFIRSVTDMFAYVRGLRMPHGTVGYTMRRSGASVEFTLERGVTVTAVGLELVSPLDRPIRGARVDDRELPPPVDGVLRLERWPARILLRY
ncbi:MAG TPA: hypothetical protein VFZ69_11255 [Longimicrobiales bacterium]